MKNRTERTRPWYVGGMLLLALVGLGLLGGSAAAKPGTDTPVGKAPAANDRPAAMPTCVPGWTVLESPNPGTDTNSLQDVAVISANDVWAVGFHTSEGTNAQTLIVHWDGERWSLVPSPNMPGNSFLRAVDGASANDVWAGGYNITPGAQSASLMHWDGTHWSIVPIEAGTLVHRYHRIYGIEAISPNDVWAVGVSSDSAVTLHWDGTIWSDVPLPSSGNYLDLRAISAVSTDDVWAVGHQWNEDGEGTATLHWDGTSWSIVPSPSSSVLSGWVRLRGVAAVSTDDVWAVGSHANPASYDAPMVLHWDGTGWSELPTPLFPRDYGNLTAVTATSANDVWIGGYTGPDGLSETVVRRWDGQVLNNVPSINPGFTNFFEGMDAASGEVWGVGHYAVLQGGEEFDRTLVARYTHACTGPTK